MDSGKNQDLAIVDIEKKTQSNFLLKVFTLIAVSLIAIVTITLVSASVVKYQRTVLEQWTVIETEIEPVREALFTLVQQAGYGGFIHHYKNFILRGDYIYLEQAYKSEEKINETYLFLKERSTDPKVQEALDLIYATFSDYFVRLREVERKLASGATVTELDAIGKIDDSQAFAALNYISKSFSLRTFDMVDTTNEYVTRSKAITEYMPWGIVIVLLLAGIGVWAMVGTKRALAAVRDYAIVAHMSKKSQSTFLANMSHEIRTPMNGIIGIMSLLNDSPLNAQQKHLVSRTQTSAETLLRIINDILDVSKIEAGKLSFEESTINLEQLVIQVGRLYEAEAANKDIELICPGNYVMPCLIRTDGIRLQQVLNNLVSNAVKFTNAGYVKVLTFPAVLDDGNMRIRFEVHDSGIGIAPEDQPTIFNRFEQIDGSYTRQKGGTGLGLAISTQIVEMMGGELTVQSDLGKGSVFSFTIECPLVKSEPVKHYQPIDSSVCGYVGNSIQKDYVADLLRAWKMENVLFKNVHDLKDYAATTTDKVVLLDTSYIDEPLKIMDDGLRESLDSNNHKLVVFSQLGGESIGAGTTLFKPVAPSELYNGILHARKCEVTDGCGEEYVHVHRSEASANYPKHVLLVEDDQTNQIVARGILAKMGIPVDIAENGHEAIAMLTDNKYDFILMDCMMPLMDGYEASTKIRSGECGDGFKDIPIVALTANAMSGASEECIKAGMSDYLAKPLYPHELELKLTKWAGHCHSDFME